jgi:hypothetical protein
MSAKRGRPVRVGMRRWLNDEAHVARIGSIVGAREKMDEERLTEVTYALDALARATVPVEALTERRAAALRRLARHATPSHIARTLLSWRLDLEDRILRKIQQRQDLKEVAEICWA